MEAALESLKSLKLGEKPNYTQVAKNFGVECSTLSRCHRGVQGSYAEKVDNSRLLNATQESELIKYLDNLCAKGLPSSRQMVWNFAAELAGKEPGKNWVDRFISRHKIDLVSRWTSGIDVTRKRADSAFKYSLYFKLLGDKIKEYNIEPRNIYNMDEKGFLIGVLSKMKRVFSRRRYDQGEIKQIIQDGNREWITTIACICADGSYLTPSLIYQAASGNIQDSWLQDFDPTEHKAFFVSSPSGWTNNQLGLAWLKQVFDCETKAKARRSYRLLILDGHGSHVTMEFIKYCDDNRILLAIYPPHSTHTLQPLDVCLFKPLSSAYSAELTDFMYKSQGISAITKRDFFRLFYKAWNIAFKKETILRAFQVTGISPLDSEQVLKRFKTEEIERPSSSDTTISVLSASDWRKIERLLRQAVKDIDDLRSKQLSQTIHTMAVQKTLLQHENEQLKEALVNEKKRRQQGKPLLLEAPEEYNGGAIFWSPSKVKDARDRQAQKDADEQLLRHQKDEEMQRRKAAKQAKADMLEERCHMRLAAKELRIQQQQVKATKRKERAAEKQRCKDMQLSKNANQCSCKPPPPTVGIAEESGIGVTDLQPVVDKVPASGPATRTRNVQLPQRYRI
jgi:hypothetical protein